MKRYLYALLCVGFMICAPILSFAQPVASFTTTGLTAGCAPVNPTFTDNSTGTGGPNTVTWIVTSTCFNFTSTGPIFNPTFVTPCTYTIVDSVSNSLGNSVSAPVTITVYNPPTISFTGTPLTGCSPLTVQFTGTYTNGNQADPHYQWITSGVPTGATNLSSSTFTYTTTVPANFDVTFTETDTLGCSANITHAAYVHVNPQPVASFHVPDSVVCHTGGTTACTNTSTGATGQTWDVIPATGAVPATSTSLNQTFTFNTQGTRIIRLISSNAFGCTDTAFQTIRVDSVVASATNNSRICLHEQGLFVNTSYSTNGFSSFWQFIGGSQFPLTSTATNPTESYFTPTNLITFPLGYPDQVTIRDLVDTQCSATYISYMIVDSLPYTNFSGVDTYHCSAPYTVHFTSASAGANGYMWNFGDAPGIQSTAQNPVHTYTANGVYTVTETDSNAHGCDSTLIKTNYIYIGPPTVTVNTFPNTMNTCKGLNYCFYLTSIPSILMAPYSLDSVHYTKHAPPGGDSIASIIYPVTTPQTLSGCIPLVDTGTKRIVFFFHQPASVGGCSFTDTIGFRVDTLPYLDTLIAGTNIGNGFFSDTTCPRTQDSFVVFCPNCTQIITPPLLTHYNNVTNATAHVSYDLDTVMHGSVQWQSPGLDSVGFILYNHTCVDTVYRHVYVDSPSAHIGDSLISCTNRFMYYFRDTSMGAVYYHWDFGVAALNNDTSNLYNPIYTFPDTGTYRVTFWDSSAHGCMNFDTLFVHVYKITDTFSASDTTACKGVPITFTGPLAPGSLLAGTPATAYAAYTWYFELPENAAPTPGGRIIAHTYNAAGLDTVRLIITDTNNHQHCFDTLTKLSYIKVGAPTPNISPAGPLNQCASFTQSFMDNGIDSLTAFVPSVGITARGWTSVRLYPSSVTVTGTGNPFSASFSVPVNLDSASFMVIVADTDNAPYGCRGMDTTFVSVTRPHASFTAPITTACPNLPLKFYNIPDSNAASSIWYWGDGSAPTVLGAHIDSTTHTYTAPGVYTDTLVVMNTHGCYDTLVHVNYIHINAFQAGFTVSDTLAPCPPLVTTVTDTSTSAFGTVYHNWSSGTTPDVTSTQNPSNFLYTLPQIYTITLIDSTAIGCKDTVTHTVQVFGPSGTFTTTPLTGCAPMSVQFCVTGLSGFGPDTSYTWIPSDPLNLPVTNNTSCYTYNFINGGTYPAGVILNSNGCHVFLPVDTVKVDEVVADFTFPATAICGSGTVQFTNTVSGNISAVTDSMRFGDGTYGIGPNPSHVYTYTTASGGIFHDTLYVKSAFGCVDTVTHDVIIHQNPVLSISESAASICPGQSVPDTLKLGVTGTLTGLGYVWNPLFASQQGTSDAGDTVTVNPVATTMYTVTATDGFGCSSVDSILVTVNPLPSVFAGNDTSICINDSAMLHAVTTINGGTVVNDATYSWQPAPGGWLACPTCQNTNAGTQVTTTYTVTATTDSGCTATDNIIVTVNPLPVITVSNDTTICSGNYAHIGTTPGFTTYTWNPGPLATDTVDVNPTATTIYTVTVQDGNTCRSIDSVTVTVLQSPTVTVSNDSFRCDADSLLISATGAGAGGSYLWLPTTDIYLTDATVASTYEHGPVGATIYQVKGTAANGCPDTAQVTITVNPLPNVQIGYALSTPDTVQVCFGSTPTIYATGAVNYTWTDANLNSQPAQDTLIDSATSLVYSTIYLSGTDALGCIGHDSTVVHQGSFLVVNASINDTTICNKDTISLSVSGGGTIYTWIVDGSSLPLIYQSCDTCGAVNVVPDGPGQTNIVVFGYDPSGCNNTDTVHVTVLPLPTIGISATPPTICFADSTTLAATGGVTYAWTPTGAAGGLFDATAPTTKASPNVAGITVYSVTVTDLNGCHDTASVPVTVDTLPVITVTATLDTICNGGSSVLTASGAGTNNYQWTGVNAGDITGGATGATITATPTVTTIYTVVGTNANGCSDSAFITIVVNPLPVVSAGNDVTICQGDFTTLGATPGYTSYVWVAASGGSAGSAPNTDTTIVSPIATDVFTVTATDSNGCINSDNVTVTVNPKPVVNAGTDVSICGADSVLLSASPATFTSYQWYASSGTITNSNTNPSLNNTYGHPTAGMATNYEITVVDANGCKDSDTVVVTTLASLPVTVTPHTATICLHDSTVLLQAGGAGVGAVYQWTPAIAEGVGSPNNISTKASPLAVGISTLYVTGSITSGTLTCSAMDSVIITVKALPVVTVMPDFGLCAGDTAHLYVNSPTVPLGGSHYTWTGFGLSCNTCDSPFAHPTVNDTVVVTGTDPLTGCSAKDTLHIFINPLPPVDAGLPTSICIGEGTATLHATGVPQPNPHYTWSPAITITSGDGSTGTTAPNATTVYTVTGTDDNGCHKSDTVSVIVNQLPVINAHTDTTICANVPLTVFAQGGTSYNWQIVSGGGSLLDPTNNVTTYTPDVVSSTTPTDTGFVHITVTGTDANHCTNTDSITVKILPLPVIDGGDDTIICKGSTVTLIGTGGTSGNYTWQAPGTSSGTGDTITVTAPVAEHVVVTGKSVNGCIGTGDVNIQFFPPIPLAISGGPSQTLCVGASLDLTATGAFTYLWSGPTVMFPTSAAITVSPDSTANFIVIGTDTHGCSDTQSTLVTVIQHVPTGIDGPFAICAGKDTVIHAFGGEDENAYTWYPSLGLNTTTGDSVTAHPDSTTHYCVSIIENACFVDTQCTNVVVNSNPQSNLPESVSIIAGDCVQLVADTFNLGSTYVWTPASGLSCANCPSPLACPSVTTTYSILVTTIAGCIGTAQTTINVACDQSQVFIPNTFTPNGDGANDRFYVSGKGLTEIIFLKVYNRWGQMVYSAEHVPANSPAFSWDGTYQGQPLEPDVFVYMVEAKCEAGATLTYKGDISLVR